MSRVWTEAEIRALGTRTDVGTAASVIGCSSRFLYEAIRRNESPVPWFRVGHKVVIPTRPLLALLHLDSTEGEAPETSPSTDHETEDNRREPPYQVRAVK